MKPKLKVKEIVWKIVDNGEDYLYGFAGNVLFFEIFKIDKFGLTSAILGKRSYYDKLRFGNIKQAKQKAQELLQDFFERITER